jgi:hypothetical protein
VALDILNLFGINPPDGTSLRTAKMVAEELAVSEDIVGRMLRKAGKKPGTLRTWCVSKDPISARMRWGVIRRYMFASEN